ncbi:EAL domain-containing protein [Paraneptunicella aestuarii]|uniref:EAL domain-containing response regulator n=1 Tax=Paraneptunicella aestuarii TaxID=2831148 RepID=UPI001E3CC832|nr:EAL domain-containing protein [Paraneptunicella aestuarii]UAA40576.1 EAL domain-containing protein [Paraneptunicella aestuarii]
MPVDVYTKVIVISDDTLQEVKTGESHSDFEWISPKSDFLTSMLSGADVLDVIVLDLDMSSRDVLLVLNKLAPFKHSLTLVLLVGNNVDSIHTVLEYTENLGIKVSSSLSKPANRSDLPLLIDAAIQQNELDEQLNSISLHTSLDYYEALSNGYFSVVYQPEIDVLSDQIVGVECLARLYLPETGMVVPTIFIPDLERVGLINQFTLLILEHSLNELQSLFQQGYQFSIAFNLNASSLTHQFVEEIRLKVASVEIDSEFITFEIDDCNDLLNNAVAMSSLKQLRKLGFNLCIDNFESCKNAARLISDTSFNGIKINYKQLSSESRNIAQNNEFLSLLNQAGKKHFKVIYKRIDRSSQHQRLKNEYGRLQQGFFLSEPLSINELREKLFLSINHNQKERTTSLEELCEKIQSFEGDIVWISNQNQVDSIALELAKYIPNLKHSSLTDKLEHCQLIIFDNQLNLETIESFLHQYPGIKSLVLYRRALGKCPVYLFELGVSDIIESNVSTMELVYRIHNILEQRTINASVNDIAMKAMRQAAQYGAIVNYCKDAFALHSPEKLLRHTIRFFENEIGVKIAISLTNDTQEYIDVSDQKDCPDLVRKVMRVLHTKGRVYQYREQRLVFNASGVCILVLNAPTDEVENGNLKDIGAAIINVLEEKWDEVLKQQALLTISSQLQSVSTDLNTVLATLNNKKNKALQLFSQKIRDSFHVMDLTIEQEEYMLDLAQDIMKALSFDDEMNELVGLVDEIREVAHQRLEKQDTKIPRNK